MSDSRVQISREEFKDALEALQKASDASRTFFSTYVLIYAGIFVFTLSAFIVPQEQDRIGDMSRDLRNAIACIFLADRGPTQLAANCDKRSENLVMDPQTLITYAQKLRNDDGIAINSGAYNVPLVDPARSQDNAKSRFDGKSQTRFLDVVQRLNTEIFEHRLIRTLDSSEDAATFTVPVVGIRMDRNWFAYLNGAAAAFLFLLIVHSLENQLDLTREIFRYELSPLQQKMLSTTQIFTSSGDRPANGRGNEHTNPKGVLSRVSRLAERPPLYRLVSSSAGGFKEWFFVGLVGLPLAVAMLVELDLLAILWPNHIPRTAFMVDWIARGIRIEVFGDAIPMPVWDSNPASLEPKPWLTYMVTLILNLAGTVILIGLFLRICRIMKELIEIDRQNIKNMVRSTHAATRQRTPASDSSSADSGSAVMPPTATTPLR
jgi:hypothetical protein